MAIGAVQSVGSETSVDHGTRMRHSARIGDFGTAIVDKVPGCLRRYALSYGMVGRVLRGTMGNYARRALAGPASFLELMLLRMTGSNMVFVEKSTRVQDADDCRNLGGSGFPVLDGVAVRGARAMLGMSQAQLCEAAGCGRNLLNDWENGLKVPGATKIADVRAALEAAGAEFFDEGGRGVAVRVDRSRAAGRTPRGRTIGEGRESETN